MLTKSSVMFLCWLIMASTGCATLAGPEPSPGKTYLFHPRYRPDRVYHTRQQMASDMSMDFVGNEALRETLRQQNLRLPMNITHMMEQELYVETGAPASDGTYPFVSKVTKFNSEMTLNGIKVPEELVNANTAMNVFSKLVDFEIVGAVAQDGTLKVKRIAGRDDEVLAKLAVRLVENINKQMDYRSRRLKIGDEFSQKITQQVPIAGQEEGAETKITTVYKLVEARGENLYFDIEQSAKVHGDDRESSLEIDSSGTGNMLYNIPSAYVLTYTGDLRMALYYKPADIGRVSTAMRSRFEIHTTVEEK